MGYEISISETRKYILARVTGPMTRQVAMQVAKDVTVLGIENKLKNYLFDVRDAPNIETNSSVYFFAYRDIASIVYDRSTVFAILATPGDTSYNFAEIVIKNAGYQVSLFTEKDSAIAWLEAPGSH
jgi:hypothetical protein